MILKIRTIMDKRISMISFLNKTCTVVFTLIMLTLSVFWTGLPNTVQAESVRVMAVVNGQPITSLDFEERRNFLVNTTGIKITDDNRERINQDTLQMLIDDVIKKEEGLRIGSGFEATARQRASELVDTSFAQYGEDPDEVMSRLGISRQMAENKFLVDVLWASSIQSLFADQFANITSEAELELERIRENASKPQVELQEIILVPEPNRNFAQTIDVANQMYDAILQGADFGRIAQQYSVSGSARNGGNLGWVPVDKLAPQIKDVIASMPSGAIARPIEIDGAVAIYRVKGVRRNGNADPLESTVTVARLVVPVEESDSASREASMIALADEVRDISTCDGLAPIHARGGNTTPLIMGEFTLGEIAPKLRAVLMPLKQGEKTAPINFAEGLVVFMICEKIVPVLDLPSVEEIETQIRNRHFSVLSSRHLQRLRRQAVISIRDGG